VRRLIVVVGVLAVVGSLTTPGAFAQTPPPAPPPNPTGQQLDTSRGAVDTVAGQLARLTGQLASVQTRVDDLQQQLAVRREDANRALVDLQTAQRDAADARTRADRARTETTAATAAITIARTRLDDFAVAAYQGTLDTGPLGLLSTASNPEDLVARAQLTDAVAAEQTQALDALQRALVA